MKKYSVISNKKRNQLVLRVAINGQSVSRVAKQLRMKLPSAKSILRTYKKNGRIFDKKRVINRGLRQKKNDLSQTEHHHSQELLKVQKSQPEVKIEPLENRQGEVKHEVKSTQHEQKFQPINPNLQKVIDDMLKYKNYLQICLQRELNYFKGLIGYYRIPSFLQKQN